MKLIIAVCALTLLQACAFYPKTKYPAGGSSCDLYFKELTVDVVSSRIQCQGGGNTAAACIILAGVVAGGTAVVSGSIVLVGNTLHWLEKQGRCDDSYLNSRIFKHNKPLLDEEGVLVEGDGDSSTQKMK